jgi:hypothetical protein
MTEETFCRVLKSVEPNSTVTKDAVNARKVIQCQIRIASEFFCVINIPLAEG